MPFEQPDVATEGLQPYDQEGVMPIESCTLPDGTSGYRWGGEGKCYKEKADAEAQGRAAYASEYEGKLDDGGKAMNPTLFARIYKVDEEKRLVYGRVTEEVIDRSDEIFDYAGSKAHFQDWSDEQYKASNGKSYGNVRAMHGHTAAGVVAEPLMFDDVAKTIDAVSHIVDDNEWKKVATGVYTGYSLGGSYIGAPKVEKMGDKDVKRYIAKPSEISLVDRPCVPTATFFEMRKTDGSIVKVEFQKSEDDTGKKTHKTWTCAIEKHEHTSEEEAGDCIAQVEKNLLGGVVVDGVRAEYLKKREERMHGKIVKPKAQEVHEYEVAGTDEEVAALQDLMVNNKMAVGDVVKFLAERVAAEKSAEAERVQKEADGKELVAVLGTFAKTVEVLGSKEGFGSDLLIVEQVGAWVEHEATGKWPMQKVDDKDVEKACPDDFFAKLLPSTVRRALHVAKGWDREVKIGANLYKVSDLADLVAQIAPDAVVFATKAVALALFKDLMALQSERILAFDEDELRKAGRRNNSMDQGRIQKVHDMATELGASCGSDEEGKKEAAAITKADDPDEKLKKAIIEALAPVRKQNEDMAAKLAAIAAEPRAPRGVLKVVDKARDALLSQDLDIQPITNRDGTQNDAATAIKAIHMTGGIPIRR